MLYTMIILAAVRSWYQDANRLHKNTLVRFVEDCARPSLIRREIALIEQARRAKGGWDSEASEFTAAGNSLTGEFSAIIRKEDSKVEMKIKLPPSYPLANIEIECSARIGVSDGRWRRWLLQMTTMLAIQDAAVIDAMNLWRGEVEKELEGLEPCPICYSVMHPKTLCLPVLGCATCSNKFHKDCLYQWFKTRPEKKCVICQTEWRGWIG